MSHDFRTPINGILGMLEIIHKSENDQQKVRECIGKIQTSTNHLLDLVNDVLDMNKLESGNAVIEQESFNLNELMDEVRTLLDAQIEELGLTHRTHRSSIEHPNLIGSPLRLRQIMLNLFSNAVKHNKEHGSIDTYATELSSDGKTAWFEFEIKDTGIGMSKEFIEKELFKPFTQEQTGARTHYKGTGLGMSIVKALVDKMGGTIEVESEKGKGSAFTFTLPFAIDASAKLPDRAIEEPSSTGALEGMHILVAEDNEINMEIAEFYLQEAGATVEKARNGHEAVEKFSKAPQGTYSLILMDLMMPVMDGLAATSAIRALQRDDAKSIPIVAMTAKAFDEDKEASRLAGMDEYLIKPIDQQKLADTCRKLCKQN